MILAHIKETETDSYQFHLPGVVYQYLIKSGWVN
jgi:hypothetical protein